MLFAFGSGFLCCCPADKIAGCGGDWGVTRTFFSTKNDRPLPVLSSHNSIHKALDTQFTKVIQLLRVQLAATLLSFLNTAEAGASPNCLIPNHANGGSVS